MKRRNVTFIRRMETAALVTPSKLHPLAFLQRERVKLNGTVNCQGGNIFHGMTGSVYGLVASAMRLSYSHPDSLPLPLQLFFTLTRMQ